MNKSKFLKKSLAAILSVLLVVAMIPLSAAAEAWDEFPLPNMTRLYINGNDVAVDGNGVFAADISDSADSVGLRADSGSLTNASLKVLKVGSVQDKDVMTGSNTIFDFDDYATEEDGVVTLNLRMVHDDNNQSFKDFTVVLTRTTDGTTAEIETATPVQSTGMYTASIGDHVINVTVARAAGSTPSINPSIVLKAKDNATITLPGGSSMTINPVGGGNSVTINKVTDGQTFIVTSQSGNNTAEWTFKVTKVDALDSFSVNGVAGVISDETGNDGIPDTVTVSLDEDVFTNNLGNDVTSKLLPLSFVVKGNVTNVVLDTTHTATTVGSPLANTQSSVKVGGNYTIAKPTVVGGTVTPVKYALFVPSGTENKASSPVTDYQKYTLVIDLKKSNNTAIEQVVVEKQIATIDGSKIHAVLPVKDASGNDIALNNITDIELVTDDTVTSVYMDEKGGDAAGFFKKGTTANGKTTWVLNSGTATGADLTTPKIITVTAQNGEIEQYSLSAEIDSNRDLAELTSLVLQAPDGTRYDGAIKDHKITFTGIPYMTTSLAGWKVFATPNTSATAKIDTTAIVNGTTEGDAIFTDVVLAVAPDKTRAYAGLVVRAENKNDNNVYTDYNTELVLAAPKTGNTLNSLTVSAQTADPTVKKNNQVNADVTAANTIKAKVETKTTGNTGTIKLEQPFSLSTSNTNNVAVYDIVTDIVTNNGGVAFLGYFQDKTAGSEAVRIDSGADSATNAKNGQISTLVDDKETFSGSYFDIVHGYFPDMRLVVLPEEIARQVMADPDDAGNGGSVNFIRNKNGVGDRLSYGTMYSFEEVVLDPEHNANLKTIAVGDTKLTITGDTITGTLPYSLTVPNVDGTVVADATKLDVTNAKWVTFETESAFAIWNNFLSDGGDTKSVSSTNMKLIFTREADHKVNVYTYDGTAANNAALQADFNGTANTPNAFEIAAEDRLDDPSDYSAHNYKFDLKWADPNTEAKIVSFSLAGRTGTVSGQNVTVAVPYLTDVKGLIPTFTLSSGATMRLDDASSSSIESEKTTLDFSNPVKVIVTSEDGLHTEHYTITVTEGEMFTDVNPGDWFYDEVLNAATKGWILGRGDGTFDPYNTMTRAEFATIIAKTQGFNAADYPDSRFADVPSDYYASAAIAFCADNNYIAGVGNGNFDPYSPITREAAATIICRVMGYEEQSGSTTYADDARISGWAKGYVKAATAENVFQGDGTNFNPQKNLTRCEGAAILVRAIDK